MTTPISTDSHQAFERCFRNNYQALCYFAASIVGDDGTAEDAVQEVFLKLLHVDRTFDSDLHLKNYLYQAVRNQCISKMQQDSKARIIGIDGLSEAPSDEKAEALVVKSEVIAAISRAIEALPERQRQVFMLAYMEDKTNDEIAEQLGIEKNTVKVQKQRAKQQLREALKDIYPLLFIFIKSVTI